MEICSWFNGSEPGASGPADVVLEKAEKQELVVETVRGASLGTDKIRASETFNIHPVSQLKCGIQYSLKSTILLHSKIMH